jgi:hypothetical protein
MMMMTRSELVKTYGGSFVASAFFALVTVACGSRVDSGNTGSETHWLKSCSRDAECGEYSCYCGVCTQSCGEQDECDEIVNIATECSTASLIPACSGQTPERICVKRGDGQPHSDAGQSTSASNDSGNDTSESPLQMTICDGSDDVRWIHRTTRTPISTVYPFTGVYGYSFLVIDGHCNFWSSIRPGEISTGSITDSVALDVYQTSEYGRMGRYDDVAASGSCPDNSVELIWDPSGAFYGSTCDLPEELGELQATVMAAASLTGALTSLGTRSQGSLRLLIVEGVEARQGAIGWPLDLDPSSMIPESRLGLSEFSGWTAGIGFAAGSRAEALRNVVSPFEPTFLEYRGVQFEAILRDELPPTIAAALDAVARDANAANLVDFQVACDDPADCSDGLRCQERSTQHGGGTACNTCVAADDSDWLCRSNEDCCGGTVCCVDCGDKSGTCIDAVDPCIPCLANGSTWVVPNVCDSAQCVAGSNCFTSSCPSDSATAECDSAGRLDECWAAGCTWVDVEGGGRCEAVISVPPCEVTASDESVPGVTLHLETDSCRFLVGEGGVFRYRVELNQSLDFTTSSSGGGCGLCGDTTNPDTWTQFLIAGGGLSFCPECDVGCCAPTDQSATALDAQSIEGTIDWPGLQWSGPSDTANQPNGEFPAGTYDATLTFSLPGVGQVVARLPIDVEEKRIITE